MQVPAASQNKPLLHLRIILVVCYCCCCCLVCIWLFHALSFPFLLLLSYTYFPVSEPCFLSVSVSLRLFYKLDWRDGEGKKEKLGLLRLPPFSFARFLLFFCMFLMSISELTAAGFNGTTSVKVFTGQLRSSSPKEEYIRDQRYLYYLALKNLKNGKRQHSSAD